MLPNEAKCVHALPPCLSPFRGLFSDIFFTFLYILLVVLLFKMAPKRLSSNPKCKKAVMGLTEKIHVLDKLPAGMSYSAIGCEFNINESLIYIK